MTYAISKNVKTHVIITFTGEHFFITAEQEKQLRGLDNRDSILLPNAKVKISNIANILSVEEYYRQYPEKKEYYPNYTYPTGNKDQINRILTPIATKNRRKRALKQLKKGLLKYINSKEYQKTNKPKLLLQKIDNKIKKIEYLIELNKTANVPQ